MNRPGRNGRHRPLDTWTVARLMARRFRPYRLRVAASLTLIMVQSVLALASPLLLQRIIDEALPRRDLELLILLCGMMIGIGLVGALLMVSENALKFWIGQRVVADLRAEVYDHARAQRLEFYTAEGETQIQARLVSDIEGVERLLTSTAQSVLGAVTSLAVTITAMLVLSWPLAMASLLLAFGLSLLNNRFAARRRALAKQRQRDLTTLMGHVAEDLSLSGIILGRTLGRTDTQRSRFVGINEQVRQITLRQRLVGTVAATAIGATYACIPPTIYLLAGSALPDLTVGAVVVLVILQMQLSSPIQSLLMLSGSLQASVAMFERVLDYLHLETTDIKAAGIPHPAAAHVRVRNLCYWYSGSKRIALSDVGLDLPARSVTVIAGGSGSGKSTLGLILAGLLRQRGGTIEMAGVGVVDTATLRGAVTLVPQHTLLFAGTIRENLQFARDDITDQEMLQALAAVELDGLMARLRLGLDTPIGKDGTQLSGGERQRLALARALLAPCRILILDEATSALDNLTAERVHELLRMLCHDRTVVIIAHRIPRLEPADRVVVMEHGRIVERGTAAELAARNGAYARLLKAQHV